MNIDQAKAIPIAQILHNLAIHPRRTSPEKSLYLSPIRKENTPSFWVYTKPNRWHDYGIGQGGDAIDLAQAYLKFTREDHTVSDALRWLSNIGLAPIELPSFYPDPLPKSDPELLLKDKKPIQHLGLVQYLHKRGIDPELARLYLKEIHVRNRQTRKSFFALGLANVEGGYELRNPFFKGSLGPKAISFIRGSRPKPDSIHLFEGSMDYLSALMQANVRHFNGDTIVLNSVTGLPEAIAYIRNYGYRRAYSWLDNDKAGQTATDTFAAFVRTQADLTHKAMNRLYAPHKDVNAWHMHQRHLTL